MADLSDDLGDFMARELKQLLASLFRHWRGSHRSGKEDRLSEEQRELNLKLDKISRQNPTDPVVAVVFDPIKNPPLPAQHPAAEFYKELQARGYNNITLIDKDTLAVPQSVVSSVMELARRLGYKEWQRDPMGRELVVVECGDPQRCAELARQMRADHWDVEQGKGTQDQGRLVCMVGEAERDEFMRALAANGLDESAIVSREELDAELAAQADAQAAREEVEEQGLEPAEVEREVREVVQDASEPEPEREPVEPAEPEAGVREVIADGEVVSVVETVREHPDTGLGEDAVDQPGGPDDEAPEPEENDPLEKQRADAEGWLRQQGSGQSQERGEISRPEESR